MDKKTTDIVAYVTWIGWIVAFLAGDKVNSKFHLNQSLIIFLASIASGIIGRVLLFIPFIGAVIASVINIVVFVYWLLGLISAVKGEEKELPYIGEIKIIK